MYIEHGDVAMTAEEKLELRCESSRNAMASNAQHGLTSHGGTFSVSSRSQKKEPWWTTLLYVCVCVCLCVCVCVWVCVCVCVFVCG